ncbi:MAG TPA: hypothetical protein VGD52_16710 [Pseudoduganella sp.]
MRTLLLCICLYAGAACAQDPIARPIAGRPDLRSPPAASRSITAASFQSRAHIEVSPTLLNQIKLASEVRPAALDLKRYAYVNHEVLTQHQQLIGKLNESARLAKDHQAQYSRFDRAMTKYLLIKANIEAQELNMRLAGPHVIKAQDLNPLKESVQPLYAMEFRAQNGEPATPHWTVKVSVEERLGSSTPIKGLRVYALPKEMFLFPEKFSAETMEELLQDFSFQHLTSPSVEEVPVSDLRVWVGPEYSYKLMQQLIEKGELVQFKPLKSNTGTAQPIEMTFFEADIVGAKK